MSVADFKKYGQMVSERDDVRKKAKAIGMNNIKEQIVYAKTLGLTFTEEDMTAMAKEIGVSSGEELTEEQLEQVAGGCLSTVAAVVGVVGAAVAVVGIGVQVGSEASRNW